MSHCVGFTKARPIDVQTSTSINMLIVMYFLLDKECGLRAHSRWMALAAADWHSTLILKAGHYLPPKWFWLCMVYTYSNIIKHNNYWKACEIFTPRVCARGKAIGFVCCCLLSLVVSTKIATSWDLGIWATRKHNESIEISEKLLQYVTIYLAWPTSVTNSAFCWPHLSTVPTAGHVLSAHVHNWPSIHR